MFANLYFIKYLFILYIFCLQIYDKDGLYNIPVIRLVRNKEINKWKKLLDKKR